MAYVIISAAVLLSAYACFKKPYLCAMFVALIFSLSPLLQLYIPQSAVYLIIILLAALLLIRVILDRLFNLYNLLFILGALIFIGVQYILVPNVPLTKSAMGIFRYAFIPFAAYYSVIYMKREHARFSSVYLLYFIINIFIVYYRALIDYSFFGTMYAGQGSLYEATFHMGGVNYRPANLVSEILFALELVIFLYVLYKECGFSKLFIFMVVISVFPLIVMRSRSSYILIILFIAYELIKYKKYRTLGIFGTLGVLFLLLLGTTSLVFSFLNAKSGAYDTRFSSMVNALSQFSKENVMVMLFGKGVGTSNVTMGSASQFEVYVENFHLSFLYDMGILCFVAWICFHIYLFYKALSFKRKYSSYLFAACGIFLINCFSSNMTAYIMQLLWWQLVLIGLSENDTAYLKIYPEGVAGSSQTVGESLC